MKNKHFDKPGQSPTSHQQHPSPDSTPDCSKQVSQVTTAMFKQADDSSSDDNKSTADVKDLSNPSTFPVSQVTSTLFRTGDDSSDENNSTSDEKDSIMAHLVRMACSSKDTLVDNLSHIASDLCELGVLSHYAIELVNDPKTLYSSSLFTEKMGPFWAPVREFPSSKQSRYETDYDFIKDLGKGGFGSVSLCRHKLDKRMCAIKRIPWKNINESTPGNLFREVEALVVNEHNRIVRYYNAWTEVGVKEPASDMSSSDEATTPSIGGEKKCLYIAMEYCPSTLREMLKKPLDVAKRLGVFFQIVEGVDHIHEKGYVHGDLNPSNIFFDSDNNIKIGDFGLAEVCKDENRYTTRCGTLLYQAPEEERDYKGDIYSLGIIYFEICHPRFGTEMERRAVLEALKGKAWEKDGEFLESWIDTSQSWMDTFQRELIKKLLSSSPAKRPPALEILSLVEKELETMG